jgi:hypothetical protein
VNAAEDDELGLLLGGGTGELQGVAMKVGMTVDFLALIMVAEDDRTLAQRGLGPLNPCIEFQPIAASESLNHHRFHTHNRPSQALSRVQKYPITLRSRLLPVKRCPFQGFCTSAPTPGRRRMPNS